MSGDAGRFRTITAAAAALRAGEVTSLELTERAITVAGAVDAEVGAYLARFDETALAAAAAADAALAAGDEVGPLHGIPLGIKDIIETREAPTTAQSLVLDPAWSTGGDAVVVDRLRRAGAIITGKTTTMEFAIGVPDVTKPFPVPKNPWNLAHWSGGSSSGSASAVVVGSALGALGTDTAGSIRIPAAYCGITGLMPTFGRVPKSGCVPLGYSLDHIGPMARSARDCALMLATIAGHDDSDATSIDVPVDNYLAALTGDLSGLTIGYDRLTRISGDRADSALEPLFDAALAHLEALGARVVEVEVPYFREITSAGVVVMLAEGLAYHLPDLQARWMDYFADSRALLAAGMFFSSADVVQAQRARRVGQQALAALYDEVDLVVTPTGAAGAPAFADIKSIMQRLDDGDGFGTNHTGYWDVVGNPVLAVPMGVTAAGLPLSMQLAGRPFDEATVLRAGDAFQSRTDWHLAVPPLVAAHSATRQAASTSA